MKRINDIASIKSRKINAEITNEYFRVQTQNNGGGYFQYVGTIECLIVDHNGHHKGTMEYKFEDSSCGDFGSRYDERVVIFDIYGDIAFTEGCHYGSMDIDPDDPGLFIEEVSNYIGWKQENVEKMLNDFKGIIRNSLEVVEPEN